MNKNVLNDKIDFKLMKLQLYFNFKEIITFRFDEFGFRIENISDFSRECMLTEDVYEDPQHRYLIT